MDESTLATPGISSELLPQVHEDTPLTDPLHATEEQADSLVSSAEATVTPETYPLLVKMKQLRAQLGRMSDKLRRIPPVDNGEHEAIRAECRELELALHIRTLPQRMAEASLFIDAPYLKIAALRGDEHPEEVFGIEAWKGWLTARIKTKGIDIMTFEDVCALHADLTSHMPDAQPGQIRRDDALIEAKVQELLAQIGYEQSSEMGDDSQDEDDFVYSNAIFLQREVMRLKPFLDSNTRLARLLMNWYLDRQGFSPSSVESVDELFTSDFDWQNSLKKGYGVWQDILSADFETESSAECFFSQQAVEFYNLCYRKYYSAAPKQGEGMKEDSYLLFLAEFENEAKAFEHFACANQRLSETRANQDNSRLVLHTGGLVPEAYIAEWGESKVDRSRIRRRYYDDVKHIHRGAMLEAHRDYSAEEILILFQQPTACETSYRPLSLEGISSKSLTPVDRAKIRDAIRLYNRVLLHDFMVRRGKKSKGMLNTSFERRFLNAVAKSYDYDPNYHLNNQANRIQNGRYLSYLLKGHQSGQGSIIYHTSPAVSTTISVESAIQWTRKENLPEKDLTGLYVRSMLPKTGAYYLPTGHTVRSLEDYDDDYAYENEVSIMGGIDPNAINEARFYHDGQITVSAQRTEDDEILVTDYVNGEQKVYVFDLDGKLILKSSKQSENLPGVVDVEDISDPDDDSDWNYDFDVEEETLAKLL